ncbi:four-helix bundle copper-binding protein [Nesterenkonia sp. MY13]|uniref:Four-helix bundle copper-binding protein n=2 Tax=Micrococcaceae TaxID=1268 RepID=A0A7X8TLZ3_9MICC|nr:MULTISPECIES: four-helix bundle copper-binding protein [Nesterenkonia]NLS11225.1 four-helix bundle copper-binding protein [Nesterenkonia sedimenti]
MMSHVRSMLQAHPKGDLGIDQEKLAACIAACFECSQTCTACADACLSEPMAGDLVTCISTDQDCADICLTTGRILTRLTGQNKDVVRMMLQACREACRACAQECEEHAEMHEHCRLCAEACRRCEAACDELISALG